MVYYQVELAILAVRLGLVLAYSLKFLYWEQVLLGALRLRPLTLLSLSSEEVVRLVGGRSRVVIVRVWRVVYVSPILQGGLVLDAQGGLLSDILDAVALEYLGQVVVLDDDLIWVDDVVVLLVLIVA